MIPQLSNQIKKVACGLCLPCYRQKKLKGEYNVDLCYLANLISPPVSETTSTSDAVDFQGSLRKVLISVSRLTLRTEKEAQYDNRFGRAVFSSELKLRCKSCYSSGWRPESGESYGSTVFYYNVEEIHNTAYNPNEVHYDLRFKAQTYSPGCRIC